MNQALEGVITIATAIVGVAILAVLVSQKSNTAGVLAAGGSAFSNALSAATGPVTGANTASVNTQGGSGFAGFGSLGSIQSFALPSL